MTNRTHAFPLALTILAFQAGVASAAAWTNVSNGLTGSLAGIRSLAIYRATGDTLYVVTSGGMFKSTDTGASWRILGSIVGANAIALDPTSVAIVYAGTGHGVWKSSDGGESWTIAGLSDASVSILLVDPANPATLYAAGDGDRIYKSSDGGGNWTTYAIGLPASPFVGVASMIIDPLTPATLYVVGRGLGSALFKSTDAGKNWTASNPGPFVRLLAIDPINDALYAIRSPNGLSKSTDGGATWISTGFAKDVIALAVDPRDSRILYASTTVPVGSSPQIYKSVDGGQNWTSVMAGGSVASFIAVSPVNSSIVYAGTFVGGVLMSTDAGVNWSPANAGLSVLGIEAMAGDPADPDTVYVAGNDGLFKTVDAGTSWKLEATFQVKCCSPPPGLPPGLPPPPSAIPPFAPVAPAGVHSVLIDFKNPNVLYAGTHRVDGCVFSDTNLFKSNDHGVTWSDSISPKDTGCLADALLAMDPSDPSTLYLRYGDVLDGFGLMKTVDGGEHWAPGGFGADALDALAIDPTDSAKLYAGTNNGVLRTTDGDGTWKPSGLAQANVHLLAIDAHRPNVIYAVTTGFYPQPPGFRGMFKSTDGGGTWAAINLGLEPALAIRASVNALVLDPDRADTLYLATSGHGVFKSSDGGVSWAFWNDGLTDLDVRALAIHGESSVIYAGTPGGLFRLLEDGQ